MIPREEVDFMVQFEQSHKTQAFQSSLGDEFIFILTPKHSGPRNHARRGRFQYPEQYMDRSMRAH
jgi:hypothetical protein